jgi:molecular chaperone GrpE
MSETRKVKILSREEDDPIPNPGDQSGPVADTTWDGADATSTAATSSSEDRVKELESLLEAKEKEFKENYDRLLRVTAEFENYKKRMSREMDDFRKYANQSLIKEMLSVVDHIELALQAAAAGGPDTKMSEGLHLTLKELLRILEKFNVKPIDAVGKPFNPEFHEAILREASDEFAENTVVREMQKGYMINQRLLRPALVVVAVPEEKANRSGADDGFNGNMFSA